MIGRPELEAPLARGEGVAVWRQLAERLEQAIRAGGLQAGRLPAEAELAARFGVNRHTLRRAIAALAARGLVRAEQGRGVFVTDVVLDYPLRERTSFSANLLAQGREPSGEVLAIETLAAPPAIARALDLAPGALIVRSVTRGFADGVPLCVGCSDFPAARLPGLAAALAREPSISAVLRGYGLADYRRRSTRIVSRLPSAEEAARLKQAPSQPVLVTEAIDVAPAGWPVRHGITCFAGARIQITVEA